MPWVAPLVLRSGKAALRVLRQLACAALPHWRCVAARQHASLCKQSMCEIAGGGGRFFGCSSAPLQSACRVPCRAAAHLNIELAAELRRPDAGVVVAGRREVHRGHVEMLRRVETHCSDAPKRCVGGAGLPGLGGAVEIMCGLTSAAGGGAGALGRSAGQAAKRGVKAADLAR